MLAEASVQVHAEEIQQPSQAVRGGAQRRELELKDQRDVDADLAAPRRRASPRTGLAVREYRGRNGTPRDNVGSRRAGRTCPGLERGDA